MRALLILCSLIGILAVSSWAAEPAPVAGAGSESNQKLLQRIAELEKRIAALEARIARQESAPRRYTTPPETGRPAPAVPRFRYTQPVPPSTSPQPYGQVPDKWQRFEFNGHYFYIIPTDEFASPAPRPPSSAQPSLAAPR